MPHFNLRYFLESLGEKRGKDVFLLQIGAMDGKTFDPVHEYIERFGWHGLLIEPVAEQFERLQETYKDSPNITLANLAVAEKSGDAVMHCIRTKHVESSQVPKWGLGASSFYKDRNALAFDSIKDLVVEERVKCATLSKLLEEYKVGSIDVLQIDTEGHDYHVLKQLEFKRYQPLVINLEIVNLPKSEQTSCKQLLDKHGYIYIKAGYDLLAVSQRFFMGN